MGALQDALAELDEQEELDSTLTVTLPDGHGGQEEFTIEQPTMEQLLLFAFDSDQRAANAILNLIEDLFDADAYQTIRRRLRLKRTDPARLTIADLAGVIETVLGSRTSFPTTPSSDSSESPTPTGRRSTGRVHSPASIRSA